MMLARWRPGVSEHGGGPVDPRVDAALAGVPLAPLPEGFAARAMARIHAEASRARSGVATDGIDPRVDAALASVPLAALPEGFVAQAMARVRAEAAGREGAAEAAARGARPIAPPPPVAPPGEAARPGRLSLPVLDVLMPAFLAALLCVAAGLAVWSLNAVDPFWSARLELRAMLTWESARVAAPQLGAGFAIAVGAGFTFVACLAGLALSLEPMLAAGAGRVGVRRLG